MRVQITCRPTSLGYALAETLAVRCSADASAALRTSADSNQNLARKKPGAPVPPIQPPQDGYLFLDKAKFPASFAADVGAEKAAFMADSQVPWGVAALSGAISEPAWKVEAKLGPSRHRG